MGGEKLAKARRCCRQRLRIRLADGTLPGDLRSKVVAVDDSSIRRGGDMKAVRPREAGRRKLRQRLPFAAQIFQARRWIVEWAHVLHCHADSLLPPSAHLRAVDQAGSLAIHRPQRNSSIRANPRSAAESLAADGRLGSGSDRRPAEFVQPAEPSFPSSTGAPLVFRRRIAGSAAMAMTSSRTNPEAR